MDSNGQTSTTGAAEDAPSTPLELSSGGETFVQSLGSNVGQGAAGAIADNASTIGANFVSGVTGQLAETVQPYLPWIIVGAAVLLLIRR